MKTELLQINRIRFGSVCLIDAAVYAAAGGISHTAVYPLAGLLLGALALFHFVRGAARAGMWASLEGIFLLSWIGGQALAQLRLSRLQVVWGVRMWVLLYLTVFFFVLAAQAAGPDPRRGGSKKKQTDSLSAVYLGRAAVVLALTALVSLMIEYARLGFLPIFASEPHAYFYFHIKGLHYITVSAIYVPALAVLYREQQKKEKLPASVLDKLVAAAACIALLIPVVLVSRYQLFYAVFFAVVCYLASGENLTRRAVIILLLAAVCGYAVLTVLRRHDIEYLNGIFEPRWAHMPIFITQPYMYIVNNYENLNCLVEKLQTHAHGVRSLAPLWALTGLKDTMPELPVFKTKSELSTLTVFYDAYYDFGYAGVCILSAAFGWVAVKVRKLIASSANPVSLFLYGQLAVYYALSFFMPFTSDLSVWFGFFLTLVIYLYVERGMRHGAANT